MKCLEGEAWWVLFWRKNILHDIDTLHVNRFRTNKNYRSPQGRKLGGEGASDKFTAAADKPFCMWLSRRRDFTLPSVSLILRSLSPSCLLPNHATLFGFFISYFGVCTLSTVGTHYIAGRILKWTDSKLACCGLCYCDCRLGGKVSRGIMPFP